MVNKYYQPGDGRAAKVHDLFAAIAPRYDLINDLQSFGLHRHWKRRLVRLASPQPGEHALDLCCGTGDIAFGLARHGAEVVGLDFSEAMLGVAREKGRRQRAEGRREGSVSFEQGDASQLPFPDEHFDIVTVGYGLRNLTSWERGLTEMHRVARPGGRLLVLDFGKPDHALWRRLYFGYLRWFVPLFGKIFCGDSATHAYILESLQEYPAQRGVEAGMNDLKCADVRVIQLLGGIMGINYGRK
jgi:demethylmenaquinone methyltransferase/2-methoxy-6-polyprenyl-1,4-benzoquinol methylase